MAPRTMTAVEWEGIFPTWPKRRQLGITASDLVNTKFTTAFTVVMTRERWEQNLALSDDSDVEVRQSIGRWLLTDFAIECASRSYQISYDRLNEIDWFHHLLEKAWFYDPTDFLDAYESARTLALPNETVEARSQATERLLQGRTRFPIMFAPSRVTGNYLYLPGRMREEERSAFATFLADNGYYAEHP